MKKLLFLCFFLVLAVGGLAKPKTAMYEYDICGVAVAKDGYYLVEVSVMVDKRKDATLATVQKCAIHGCLFKGFVMDRIAQKPIMPSPQSEQEHHEFFTHLLTEQYEQYTSSSQTVQVTVVGKRFRVKAIVAVAKDSLRRDLEKAGIIRKLGF